MKSLAIINENFTQMHLGQNTTLAYILGAVSSGFDVGIFNLDKNSLPKNRNSTIPCLILEKNSNLAQKLLREYRLFNEKIVNLAKSEDFAKLSQIKTPMVADFLNEELPIKEINLGDFDKIIQRLEPMKKPFPPAGNEKIDDILLKLSDLLPNQTFNCPIGLNDKETPQLINELLNYNVATPTQEFVLEDQNIKEKLDLAILDYQKIYQNSEEKIVIKPKNSAQSLGVFAIEFCKDGADLAEIITKTTLLLKETQIFKVRNNLDKKELDQIVRILCFAQNSKQNLAISEIPAKEIFTSAKELYNAEILVQPFIEGIKFGDIRASILKNQNGDFYCLGFTYRKSVDKKAGEFTTGYVSGQSISLPITYLSKNEQKNLELRTRQILDILNNQLKENYRNTTELGFDFLIVGDDKNILLGEINHHCTGLIPISEAMNKVINDNDFYDGGIGFVRELL